MLDRLRWIALAPLAVILVAGVSETSCFELVCELRDHVEAASSSGLGKCGGERDFNGVHGRLIGLR